MLRLLYYFRVAATATFWFVSGKRQRARNQISRLFAGVSQSEYASWIQHRRGAIQHDRSAVLSEIASWNDPPLISVVLAHYNAKSEEFLAAVNSIRSQIYPHWELCITDDGSDARDMHATLSGFAAQDTRIRFSVRGDNGGVCAASNDALELATGSFVAFMDQDDVLCERALYAVAREIIKNPGASLIYSDEDFIDQNDRRQKPHFKPDWNRELFLSHNYVNHLSVFRTSIVERVGGLRHGFEGCQDYDLTLRVLLEVDESTIRHVPEVLYHWRNYPNSGAMSKVGEQETANCRQKALQEYLDANGEPAEVLAGPFGCNRVRYPLPDPQPTVTLVILTKDKVSLIRECIDSILNITEYSNFEILIVDNGSEERSTIEYLESIADGKTVRVLKNGGPFNYSALNNFAVSRATGSVLAFLNNDTEIVEPDWLREMVSHALRDRVGAVGAKLLYPDGTIQHAGIVCGISGTAGHSFRGLPDNLPGPNHKPHLTQNVAAVTGACLVVTKKKFLSVGGYDEENFRVAYNDVDLCLKLGQAGLETIYTPFAKLIHHESKSRGRRFTAQEMDERSALRQKWPEQIRYDPHYNVNLTRRLENHSLDTAFSEPQAHSTTD